MKGGCLFPVCSTSWQLLLFTRAITSTGAVTAGSTWRRKTLSLSPKSKTRCGSFENAERRVLSSVHANANALHLEKHNTVCLTAMSARIAQNSLLYLSSSNQSNEARRNLAAFACRRVASWTSLTSAAHQKSRGEAWAWVHPLVARRRSWKYKDTMWRPCRNQLTTQAQGLAVPKSMQTGNGSKSVFFLLLLFSVVKGFWTDWVPQSPPCTLYIRSLSL